MTVFGRPHRYSGPLTAWLLGGAGLLPFIGGAFAIGLMPSARNYAAFALVGYGAVILSFLGGIRWGFAVLHVPESRVRDYTLSVLPSLVAWGAALLAPRAALLVLSAALILWFAVEIAVPLAGIPRWYVRLRALLTTIASGSLLAASLLW